MLPNEDVRHLLQNIDVDNDLFSEDEKLLLSKGGFSVSESEANGDDHESDDDYERKIMEVISSDVGVGGLSAGYKDMDFGERSVLEDRFKFENNYLQLQLANQKATFYKKAGELERATVGLGRFSGGRRRADGRH